MCRKALVEQMGTLVKHYIALAAHVAAKDAQAISFPSTFKRVVSSLPCVSVPSQVVPVRPDSDYTDVPHIAGVLLPCP